MPLLGKKSDVPPVDVFELVTNDLSTNNLQHYLHIYRQKELQLFNSNSVPYLINTDCARNLLVAVLKEYNNKTPEQYFNRIINTIITNEEFDSSKVLVGWCYGHAIRAVRHHIRSKKFTIEEGGSREILAKFAMRVWNSVRVKENIDEIENEIDRWEWLMIQKNLELINKRVSLIKKNRFRDNFGEISLHDLPSIDFESNQNLEDLDLAVYPQNLPLNSDKINNTWTYTIMGDSLLKIIQNYNSYELLILQLGININV
ncbi:unnamed protein product [Rhizophagus irregularis]|nr:unnamed protein product [Rhizophagus irregularis]